MRILFLFTALSGFKRSNHLMFHNAFLDRGWDVDIGKVNSLAIENGEIFGETCCVRRPIEIGDNFDGLPEYKAIAGYDLVWVMNQPHHNLAADIYQVLWLLSKRTTFVNSIESMVFLNNKNTLSEILPRSAFIESYATSSSRRLLDAIDGSDHPWIIKPTNDGNGTNVLVLHPHDTNRTALIQAMTGNETTQLEIHGERNLGVVRKFALLQPFIEGARNCEKRVVIAGGKPVQQGDKQGVYQTVFRADDHRSNRIHTPEKLHVELTDEEYQLCLELGERLLAYGIRFTAIDMAFPFIFEINVVNPGGLQTVDLISGLDLTPAAVDQILCALCLPNDPAMSRSSRAVA
jgi:glutathione synthase